MRSSRYSEGGFADDCWSEKMQMSKLINFCYRTRGSYNNLRLRIKEVTREERTNY